MTIGQSAVGEVFTADRFSFGTITSDPQTITYTEVSPGFESGTGATATITSVVTNGNVTTVTVQFAGSTNPAMNGTFTGTLPANNESSIVLTGNFPGQASTNIFLTNAPSQQPGRFGTEMVASEAQGLTYAPQMICFASGTLIRTVQGEVPVEALRVGDHVVTSSGVARPIRWIGHRQIDYRRHACRHEAHPVCIAAHAFGPGLPKRDLLLSPGHPVLVGADADGAGGYLVPIMCLINGTTIEHLPVDHVDYWHVELDTHDILLAEDLPAESYIDLGSRPWFDGADGALYDPDLALPGMPGRCRPVAIDGPVVEAERIRLDVIFTTRLVAACHWPGEDAIAGF